MTRILVIEDEPFLREEILEILGFEGFEAVGAEDGRRGVELAQGQRPDLIICDIMMPSLDGFGVLKEIREAPDMVLIPFIFLTAKADKMDVRLGMQQGADDYLTKPFTKAELLDAITARLERQASIAQAHQQHVEEAKRVFSRMVAHELRTPLVSINMVQDIISRSFQRLSASDLQELMESLGSGSRRLTHLVEQMVLLIQLETRVLDKDALQTHGRPVSTQDLLKSAVEMSKKFATRNRGAQLIVEADDGQGMVMCDSRALKHALAEIITNAINFSPENGEVTVKKWEERGLVWISCLDKGAGIPEDQLARIFENFYQVNRETQEQQGVGMGLPLAQRIFAVHGGEVRLESVLGKGTEAVIRLPLFPPG